MRRARAGTLRLELLRDGEIVSTTEILSAADWMRHRVSVGGRALSGEPELGEASGPSALQRPPRGEPSRWPGEGQLRIEEVTLLDARVEERAVYVVGEPLNVRVRIRADAPGAFTVSPAAIVFRTDGVVMTRHVGEATTLELDTDDHVDADLELGSVGFGNGYYFLSVGLYRFIDVNDLEPSNYYDYIDRSYEFQVVGAPRLHNELVIRPISWRLSVRPGNGVQIVDVPPLWVPGADLLLETGGRFGSGEEVSG